MNQGELGGASNVLKFGEVQKLLQLCYSKYSLERQKNLSPKHWKPNDKRLLPQINVQALKKKVGLNARTVVNSPLRAGGGSGGEGDEDENTDDEFVFMGSPTQFKKFYRPRNFSALRNKKNSITYVEDDDSVNVKMVQAKRVTAMEQYDQEVSRI